MDPIFARIRKNLYTINEAGERAQTPEAARTKTMAVDTGYAVTKGTRLRSEGYAGEAQKAEPNPRKRSRRHRNLSIVTKPGSPTPKRVCTE